MRDGVRGAVQARSRLARDGFRGQAAVMHARAVLLLVFGALEQAFIALWAPLMVPGRFRAGLSRARAALRHPRVLLWNTRAGPRGVPAATFERWDVKRGGQGAPSGPEKTQKLVLYDSTMFSCHVGPGSCPDRLRVVSIFPLKPVQIYY